MKVTSDAVFTVPAEKVWEALADFGAYPEWNPLVKSMEGNPEPQGSVQVTIAYPGADLLQGRAEVTGWVPPKYFSFTLRKGPAWWYQEEHIFRLKTRDDGKVVFYNEVYATGLSLRFGRKASSHRIRHSLDRMNEELKIRVEGPKA